MKHITHTSLQQKVIERIRKVGFLSFAEYMRMALYEPGYGYYVTGSAKMGWEGDYYTSTDLSKLFAHCMGRQLQQMWDSMGQPSPFVVLEQGAGRGDLARDVQSWASQQSPAFAAALDYHTTDISSGQSALTPSEPTQQYISPSVILSNELIDAFPVHIVEKRGQKLYEVYVVEKQGQLYEILSAPSSDAITDYLDTYKIPWRTFADEWRAEINLNALHWMEQTAKLLYGPHPGRKRRGFIITIDYGAKARELYTPERNSGTLTCYFRHQLSDQPLVRPGEQDITAHVNFSALLQAGRSHGLRLHLHTTQRQWLNDLGILEELEQIRRRDFAILDNERSSDAGQVALLRWYDLRQRVMALTTHGGMGDFNVLIMKH